MELRIEPYSAPEPIVFNYEELKTLVAQTTARYETMVYTGDQIKDAKADRANLNRLKKALNDERIKREREYMENFNVFKSQIGELIGIIDASVANVDKQVKAHEERMKEEKRQEIEAYWNEACQSGRVPEHLSFGRIFNEKWLNASVSMKSITEEIDAQLEQIAGALTVCDSLPAFAFEARETYLDTLDLARAVGEAHRLTEQAEKRKAWEAEQERRRAAQEAAGAAETVLPTENTPEQQTAPVEPAEAQEQTETVYVLRLEMQVTKGQAAALKAFLTENGIPHHKI